MGKSKNNKSKTISNAGGRKDDLISFKKTPQVPCNNNKSSVQKASMTRKKNIEYIDSSTQYDLQEASCESNAYTIVNDKLRLLELENCQMKNELDSQKQENNDLKKINEALKSKIDLLQRQLEISNGIVEMNKNLKLENDSLREKCGAYDDSVLINEELKNENTVLKEKVNETNQLLQDYKEKEEEVNALHKKLNVSEKIVENMVEILSNCPSKQCDCESKEKKSEPPKQNNKNLSQKSSTSASQSNSSKNKADINDSDVQESENSNNFDYRNNYGLKRTARHFDYNGPPPRRWKNKGNDPDGQNSENRVAGNKRNYFRKNNWGTRGSNYRGRGRKNYMENSRNNRNNTLTD